MTTNAAPKLGTSVTLLVLAWFVVTIGIYPAIEDRSLVHPLTQSYFLFALAAAVAPFGYSIKRLANWRTWILVVLSIPPLFLVIGIAYRLATGTLR
jgi:hypothetical protein